MIYKDIGYLIPISSKSKRPIKEWKNEDGSVVDFAASDLRSRKVAVVPVAGVICIDIDVKDEKKGLESMLALGLDPCSTLAQKTPSGGYHLIYRVKDNCKIRQCVDLMGVDSGVDIRTAGMGYFVLYNSWIDIDSADISIESASVLTDEQERVILSYQKKAAKKKITARDIDKIESNRNQTLTSIAGQLWHAGATIDELCNQIHGINARKCIKPLDKKEVDIICASVSRYDRTIADDDMLSIQTSLVSEYFERIEKEKIKNTFAEFPKSLCNVSGLIKKICDAINSSGQYITPHLSLSCAVGLLSCLYGRKWVSPTGARTNLFVIGLGMAGSGKENARKFVINLLTEIESAKNILGGSSIKSGAGLIKSMTNHAQRFYLLDEFGLVLQSISNDKSPQYLKDIAKVLLEFYSASGSAYLGSDAASDENSTGIIKNPILSIYGTSTPSTFYKSITNQTIISGELPRYLVVDDPAIHKIDNKKIENVNTSDIKKEIEEVIKYSRYGDSIENLMSDVVRVNYASKNAEKIYTKYREYINKTYVDEINNGLWSRACENVQKLATIRAISDDFKRPAVTVQHIEWAIDFVDYSVNLIGSRLKTAITSKYGEERQKLINFIKDQKTVTKTQINRYMQMQTRQLRDLIDDLIDSNEIACEKLKDSKSCKPKNIYSIKK